MKSRLRQIVEAADPFRKRHARMRGRIAKRINAMLKAQGMKQVELAEAAKVPASFISRILRGSTAMTTETIAKIEQALGRDIIHVLDPDEPELITPDGRYMRITLDQSSPLAPRTARSTTTGIRIDPVARITLAEAENG